MKPLLQHKNCFMRTRQYLLPVLLLCTVTAHTQDLHFSQFFEAPLLRNPSLAGIYTGDVRVQGVYRDQWNSVTNAYRTGSLNAEYKMPIGKGDDFMTTGLQVLFDKAGTVGLTTTELLPALNYHKSLSNEKTMYLSLGFMGGMVRKSIDASKITTDNQYGSNGYDPSLPTGETFAIPNFTTWDASVGMSFNESFGANQANSLFLGAAYHHLNRPKNSFYRNPAIEMNPKYVFSAGVKFNMDDYSYFTIQADHSIQGGFNETVAGVLYSLKLGDLPENPSYTIHGGAFLRWKDALIPVIKVDVAPISIAISYDINVSQLKTASMGRGGFELSLSYIAFLDRHDSSRDKVLCPHF
jgi:type IX secretion system PorP/SprF family membrane protein